MRVVARWSRVPVDGAARRRGREFRLPAAEGRLFARDGEDVEIGGGAPGQGRPGWATAGRGAGSGCPGAARAAAGGAARAAPRAGTVEEQTRCSAQARTGSLTTGAVAVPTGPACAVVLCAAVPWAMTAGACEVGITPTGRVWWPISPRAVSRSTTTAAPVHRRWFRHGSPAAPVRAAGPWGRLRRPGGTWRSSYPTPVYGNRKTPGTAVTLRPRSRSPPTRSPGAAGPPHRAATP